MTKKHLRILFYALVLTLIFEGVTRKMIPPDPGKFLILLKDVILVLIAVGVLPSKINGTLKSIRNIYLAFAVLLSPLIFYTFSKDPILAIYGAKQYLLYPYTLFGFALGFQDYRNRNFVMPTRLMTVLLIPLTGLAIIQIFLPSSHWLNLSVAGEDLSAFSAGGRLRVSSTFPFVAQFCYFLSVLLPILWVTQTLKRKTSSSNIFNRLESLYILIPLFIVSNVITGSRLSVITNLMTIVFSAGLLLIRGKSQNIGRLVGFIIGIVVSIYVARIIVPEAFEAYDARTGDYAVVNETEMTERADHILTGWWEIYKRHNPGTFGFGIGVMSNGVQNFSPYAASIRERAWGETDLANTVLEGGLYLVTIWMLTRIIIIILSFKLYVSIKNSKLIYAASFCMGYIIFNGLTQTLGVQPPLAIWWWLAIGLLVHLKRFEIFQLAMAKERKKRAHTTVAAVTKSKEPPDPSSDSRPEIVRPTAPKPPPPGKNSRRPLD